MPKRLLIANRGEIAIRIAQTAAANGVETVGIHSTDDDRSLHCRRVDHAVALDKRGVAAYLDIEAIINVAKQQDCDAIHPGYGFLAENAEFAQRCEEESITFVGPTAEQLSLFGDKVAARRFAQQNGAAILAGTDGAADLKAMEHFFESLPDGSSVIIKALAGGGGRGMRVVHNKQDLGSAFERCASEAAAAFGNAALYIEQFAPDARHLEVQIVGDGNHHIHLWERECTLQRRHQKLIEMAPSPSLDTKLRDKLCATAVNIAKAANYRGVGTFEFLLYTNSAGPQLAFMEANPRIQVEHTVTEAVTGVDVVALQLQIADGQTLSSLGHKKAPPFPEKLAIQARVNMETMQEDGATHPAGGTLFAYEPPSGSGVRVDGYGYSGYTSSPAFDSLLAKVIVTESSGDYKRAITRLERSLAEFRIEGIATNTGFLRNLLRHPDVVDNRVHTGFIDTATAALVGNAPSDQRFFGHNESPDVLEPHQAGASPQHASAMPLPDGQLSVDAPMQGTVLEYSVQEGDSVQAGQALLVMEAMKMEHLISAPVSGIIRRIEVRPNTAIFERHRILVLEVAEVDGDVDASREEVDPDYIRQDLQESIKRHSYGLDENRPQAVAKRHGRGNRTARENIADLVDPGTFKEYGALLVAAQRRRRSMDDLVKNTTGDGMVAGIGQVNGAEFGPEHSYCVAMSYDYMVLAGTQGIMNHLKKDRLFEIAHRQKLPLVLFAEGGGGRPGDTDGLGAGLEVPAFYLFAKLSGVAPLVGITNGYCFAGNAALLGCCDVIIATANSNMGMGGPAMIEGGGLGVFDATEVGPMSVQVPNGVVDIAVADEAEAVAAAKQYLGYFQGNLSHWETPDQRALRHLVPENRLRAYDVRRVLHQMFDEQSVLELRPEYGIGILTALARIEGRPVGVIANNPSHLGGAIDAPAADKAARFLQLCDVHGLPVVSLCDTPGFMVGPEAERDAQVRRFGRMFTVAANLTVPMVCIVLRKGYGLGAMAMAAGCFRTPIFSISWPSGEFGGMGLEGAVRLGFKNEMEAIEDPEERQEFYEKAVARMYASGKAITTAQTFELDDVIDPAESRSWIKMALESSPPRSPADKRHWTVSPW